MEHNFSINEYKEKTKIYICRSIAGYLRLLTMQHLSYKEISSRLAKKFQEFPHNEGSITEVKILIDVAEEYILNHV